MNKKGFNNQTNSKKDTGLLCNKKNINNKKDRSTKFKINMKDNDLIIVLEKFRTSYEKSFMSNQDFVKAQMLSEEILRIKALTRKQFNIPCSKSYV